MSISVNICWVLIVIFVIINIYFLYYLYHSFINVFGLINEFDVDVNKPIKQVGDA